MFKATMATLTVLSSLAVALPTFAAPAPAATKAKPVFDSACASQAVGARETALAGAFTAYSTAQSAALTTRGSALQSAWSVADAKSRRAAVKQAWQTYRAAHKAAVKAHRASVKTAWSQFKTAVRACHVPAAEMESPVAGDDSLGG